MNVIRFIGDVHGRYKQYKRLLKSTTTRSIQVGDMGVGFIHYKGDKQGKYMQNPPFYLMIEGPHEFIRGNHDNPSACKRQRLWIPDGTVRNDMMFIGGGVSIDRPYRIEGYSWWADEEPSINELLIMVDVYRWARPRIMVTHDCPEVAAYSVCSYNNKQKFHDGSRCRQAFQAMWEMHKPELWIFGHWHVSFDKIIEGTRFICLNELEWIDVNMDTLEVLNKGSGHTGSWPKAFSY